MSFPQKFKRIDFAEKAFIAHKDGILVFVNGRFMCLIDSETLIFSGLFDSYIYAEAAAQQATIDLELKNSSITEVRRDIEANAQGLDETDVDADAVFE